MRFFAFALLLACDANCPVGPPCSCKCGATTCTCDEDTMPRCPDVAESRGACTTEPRCMGCNGAAGFSCSCNADDAGQHWFCIGTGYACTNE